MGQGEALYLIGAGIVGLAMARSDRINTWIGLVTWMILTAVWPLSLVGAFLMHVSETDKVD